MSGLEVFSQLHEALAVKGSPGGNELQLANSARVTTLGCINNL